jgi:hypothetical protein
VGIVVAGVQVGHSGGVLVYREGAASAYTEGAGPSREATGANADLTLKSDADDRDERRRR